MLVVMVMVLFWFHVPPLPDTPEDGGKGQCDGEWQAAMHTLLR
jgi:hypothetical protein